jgi:hypothetical protein
MATAKAAIDIRRVERIVYDEIEESVIDLRISIDEAKTLVAILARVGGSQQHIRGDADKVYNALVGQIGSWSGNGNISGHIILAEITADELDNELW